MSGYSYLITNASQLHNILFKSNKSSLMCLHFYFDGTKKFIELSY